MVLLATRLGFTGYHWSTLDADARAWAPLAVGESPVEYSHEADFHDHSCMKDYCASVDETDPARPRSAKAVRT